MVAVRDQRAANVAYYARNRSSEIARVRARQDDNLALLRDLRRVACADCARTFEPFQMDFDHRDPTAKSFRLTSPTALGSSRSRLLHEVGKCDVVCACLSSNPYAGSTSGAIAKPVRRWDFQRPRTAPPPLDLARAGAQRPAAGAVHRLWRAISALRNGFRPSGRERQADRRNSDGWTSRDREDPRRGRQVRYRVCELPPGADVPSAHERFSSGSSSVGGASPSKLDVAGSNPVSRSKSTSLL